MPRRGVWIGMAVAIPATVAFTPFHPLEPALQDPNVVAQPQPVVATTLVAPPQPVVATTPVATAQPVVATTPVAAAPATAQNLRAGSSAMAAPDRDVGSIVVNAALTRVGAPYVWGDAGPDSFDCSGLVVWAFHQAGITVPHSSEALATGGQPVALDQMQPGDEIVVTAPRLPEAPGEAVYAHVEIDPRAIEDAVRLDRALAVAPAASLFRRNDSGAANPTVQGLSLRAIGPSGAGRALVTLDGVPQHDPFGGWVIWGDRKSVV